MVHTLIASRRHRLVLALLLAGWAIPAVSGPAASPDPSASSRPDSPPDWSGARAGDYITYFFSAQGGDIPFGSGSLTLTLEVLSADAKEVRVAVSANAEVPLFARGLLFSMRRASAEERAEFERGFFGLKEGKGKERVSVGDLSVVCQKMEGESGGPHLPSYSGCVAPDERALYLGNGIVHYRTSYMSMRGRGYSYELRLVDAGHREPSQEVPPLALREGSGYERFSRNAFDVRLEQHTFRTADGVVVDDTIMWSKEEGAKRQRDDRVFEGIRLTRVDYSSEQALIEFVHGLAVLAVTNPFPSKGRPATPKTVTVGGRRVPAWRQHESWDEDGQAGEREAFYAWDPWGLKDAPVEMRFLPLSSKLTTWPSGQRKEADTEVERTLRWY